MYRFQPIQKKTLSEKLKGEIFFVEGKKKYSGSIDDYVKSEMRKGVGETPMLVYSTKKGIELRTLSENQRLLGYLESLGGRDNSHVGELLKEIEDRKLPTGTARFSMINFLQERLKFYREKEMSSVSRDELNEVVTAYRKELIDTTAEFQLGRFTRIRNPISGKKYEGVIHVHITGHGPSETDVATSQMATMFVLVYNKSTNKSDLYSVKKGKTTREGTFKHAASVAKLYKNLDFSGPVTKVLKTRIVGEKRKITIEASDKSGLSSIKVPTIGGWESTYLHGEKKITFEFELEKTEKEPMLLFNDVKGNASVLILKY